VKTTASAIFQLLAVSWAADRRRLLIAVVLMLAEACALPLVAPALGAMTDEAVAGHTGAAGRFGAIAAVLVVAGLVGGHFAHIFYMELGELNFLRLDRELIEAANGSITLAHHERADFADRIAVLKQEFQRIPTVGMTSLLTGVTLTVAMGITGVLLARLNPLLLLLPLATIPSLVAGRRAERVVAASRQAGAADTRAAQHVLDLTRTAACAKELRVLGLREELRTRHARHWRAATATLWGGELRAAAWRIGGQLCFGLGYTAATLLVIRAAVAGQRSVGSVVLVVVLAAQISQQVSSALTLLQEFQRLASALSALREIKLMVAAREPAPASEPVPARLEHGIRVRVPKFRYPGTTQAVLTDVDVLLPAGATVALVGENGAGKTTLVKLLCQFYQAEEGTIELDGIDLRRFDHQQWRGRIAAGFQDFSRFELVARQTVGVGDLPRVDDVEAVSEALRQADAAQIVTALPDGLDTPVGQSLPGGVELSGGQWQRMALGRAMMRSDPLLVVLDEPTAALDARAEHALFERYAAAADRAGRRTGAVTLLVTHRFCTVSDADLILVIADHRIAERGTHRELLARRGLYAELYALQAAGYLGESAPEQARRTAGNDCGGT
jgi:ATP-binding cassette subfamily B protein